MVIPIFCRENHIYRTNTSCISHIIDSDRTDIDTCRVVCEGKRFNYNIFPYILTKDLFCKIILGKF